MASYRQYRHMSSSNFGRPNSGLFDWANDPYFRWQMSRVPFVGDFYKAADQQKYYNDYFRSTGLSWKDVKYPALLGGQNAFGAGVNAGYSVGGAMISKNLMRLYR